MKTELDVVGGVLDQAIKSFEAVREMWGWAPPQSQTPGAAIKVETLSYELRALRETVFGSPPKSDASKAEVEGSALAWEVQKRLVETLYLERRNGLSEGGTLLGGFQGSPHAFTALTKDGKPAYLYMAEAAMKRVCHGRPPLTVSCYWSGNQIQVRFYSDR